MLSLILFLAPLPPLPQPPNLAGVCIFGQIEQTGRKLVITGSAWTAVGDIHPDGSTVRLFWLARGDGSRPIIGVYRREGTMLRGAWGYLDSVEIGGDGWEICDSEGGPLTGETFTVAP